MMPRLALVLSIGLLAAGCSSATNSPSTAPLPATDSAVITEAASVSTSLPSSDSVTTTAADTATTVTTSATVTNVAARFVEREVTFDSENLKTAATYTVPLTDGKHPAVLLIAGSGPTDRNGDNPLIPGNVGTLRFLAEYVGADAVTLRFDKLGVGTSQMPADPNAVTLTDFVTQAKAALDWLRQQPEVDPAQITIAGHSEGGLIALELATKEGSGLAGLALLSPPSDRYLTAIREQLAVQVDAGVLTLYDTAVKEIRTTGRLKNFPSDPILPSIFNANTVTFLADADERDPIELAKQVPPSTKVLLTCGDRDIQIRCASLSDLRSTLQISVGGRFTDVVLGQTNHVLRVTGDKPGGTETYADESLPHSAAAGNALLTLIKG